MQPGAPSRPGSASRRRASRVHRPARHLADAEEEGSEAVLGDADNAIIPPSGDVMLYGDGGAGKTTLGVDLGCHMAAGKPWLGIDVLRPLRVVIIENEGPRPRFRRKLKKKRDAWSGPSLGGRISVLEEPWGAFTFADQRWRELLADHVREHQVDVVICGPVVSAGMDAAGTLQEVRDFLALVADVRRRSARSLVVILVHHENKGGKVSGAWEGAGDPLLHVSAQGHGRVRLHFQRPAGRATTTARRCSFCGLPATASRSRRRRSSTTRRSPRRSSRRSAPSRARPGARSRRDARHRPRAAKRHPRPALRLRPHRQRRPRRERRAGSPRLLPERRAAHLYRGDDPTIRHLLPASDRHLRRRRLRITPSANQGARSPSDQSPSGARRLWEPERPARKPALWLAPASARREARGVRLFRIGALPGLTQFRLVSPVVSISFPGRPPAGSTGGRVTALVDAPFGRHGRLTLRTSPAGALGLALATAKSHRLQRLRWSEWRAADPRPLASAATAEPGNEHAVLCSPATGACAGSATCQEPTPSTTSTRSPNTGRHCHQSIDSQPCTRPVTRGGHANSSVPNASSSAHPRGWLGRSLSQARPAGASGGVRSSPKIFPGEASSLTRP
jgi:hypothetical protein